MADTRTLGWIGLGKMGLPISSRIAGAGWNMAGFDLDATRMAAAAQAGVTPGAALDDVAGRDMVFLSLPDDRALRGVVLHGPLLAVMRPGAVLVETSTVSPEASAEVAQAAEARGVLYLRAPVSGNAAIAHTGNLTCFVSGPRDAFETFLPVAKDFTRAQKYLGTGEEARFAKLSVNLMIAVSGGHHGREHRAGPQGQPCMGRHPRRAEGQRGWARPWCITRRRALPRATSRPASPAARWRRTSTSSSAPDRRPKCPCPSPPSRGRSTAP